MEDDVEGALENLYGEMWRVRAQIKLNETILKEVAESEYMNSIRAVDVGNSH